MRREIPQRRGSLLLTVSGEEAAFHDLGQPRRSARQTLQGLVQGKQALVRLDGQINRMRERHVLRATPALLGEALRGSG